MAFIFLKGSSEGRPTLRTGPFCFGGGELLAETLDFGRALLIGLVGAVTGVFSFFWAERVKIYRILRVGVWLDKVCCRVSRIERDCLILI